jgi:beta-lactam-binding protein with PASTA domain
VVFVSSRSGAGNSTCEPMAAATPDGRDADPDEITLAEEEWPVSDLYRVDPAELEAGPHDRDPREDPTAVVREPVRRRPPYPFHDDRIAALALAILAAIVLAVAAGWYVANGEESADATPPAGVATGSTASDTTAPEAAAEPPAASTRPVPDLTGANVQEARDVLEEAGLRVRVRRVESDQPAGDVVGQRPAAGATVSERGLVTLTVSSGPPGANVPDVVGEPASTARRELQEAGLRVQVERVASSKPLGTVIRQSPEAGTDVEGGTVVNVQVAKPRPAPPATIDVPRLVGLDVSDAQARLRDLGLRSTITRVESPKPEGTVIDQSPSAGTALERGETVAFTVSSGPAAVPVPDVTGLDEESARAQLESAGFEVTTVDEATSDPAEDGQVVGQSPSAGTERKPGTLVTLRIARLS